MLASAALTALGACIGAASAGAASFTTECSNLQQTIATVSTANHGEGAVVVLKGMCKAAYTLPAGAAFILEGAPGSTSGFDGAGVSGPLLGTIGSEEAGAMTISHLTFQHANLTDASALSIRAARVTLSGDSFLENEEHGEGAHAAFVQIGQSSCPSAGDSPAITLTGSTFSRNKLVLGAGEGGGAGAWLEDACNSRSNILEGNTFEGNVLEAAGTGDERVVSGGGLQFMGPKTRPLPVVSQRGNVFDSNSIVASAPAEGDYGGGGEWLQYASLRSVDDRFSRDLIPGTSVPADSPAYAWSWGGGLGIWTPENECNTAALPESTLEDAVIEGNAIGPGTEFDLGGGGVYVGCSHLRVLDSTVTLNTAPNGAGIEGESGDQLELVNSIVAEDAGGNETAGFIESEGGSLAASFSDICAAVGSSEPLPGTGNICANPLLADNGDPVSFDVHETASSPTIDAGSNTLVPSELTTDFYGTTRILAGHLECAGVPPAVVDMGADEFVPPEPSCPTPASESPPSQNVAPLGSQTSTSATGQVSAAAAAQGSAATLGLAHFVSLELTSRGIALRLSCSSTAGRGCAGTINVTSEERLQGKKVVAVGASNPTKASVKLGQASFSLPSGATRTFQVKLNSTGLALLHHFHAVSAWVLANEAMPSDSQVVFFLHSVRFSEPKQKRKPKEHHG